MASINNLKVGQILWQIKRVKCGNTTMTTNCLYTVKVVEIAEDKQSIMASWNGNPPRKYHLKDVKKLKVNKPEPKRTNLFGMPIY
jgi:hypothetical protein